MKELTLDGAGWSTKGDVYNAFFRAVGASEWHSRNSNAPNDRIANGSINELEVPHTLVFINYDMISGDANKMNRRLHRSDPRNGWVATFRVAGWWRERIAK
jgi:hypothetical protein